MAEQEFTKYEKARILGARALQISMDAPILSKMDEEGLSNLNFDPLRIAEVELESGILPISVKRPLPMKKEESLEKVKIDESEKTSDKSKIEAEKKEETEIMEGGEIMQLANPEDEQEEKETLSEKTIIPKVPEEIVDEGE